MIAISFIKDAKNSWDIWKSSQWKKGDKQLEKYVS